MGETPTPAMEAFQPSSGAFSTTHNPFSADAPPRDCLPQELPPQHANESTQSMGTRASQLPEIQQQAAAASANLAEDSSASTLKHGPFTEGARAILEQVQQAGMQRASFRQLGQRD